MIVRFATTAFAAAVLVFAIGASARAQDASSCTSSIRVLFNQYGNQQIPTGSTMWFSSVLDGVESANGDLGTTPIRIDVRDSRITFGNWPYTVAMPDSIIQLDPSATNPQRWWIDRSAWSVTFAPTRLPEAFFDGTPFTVPEPFFPGSSGPVTWTATFTASRPGITLRWAWSAAVYSQFGANGHLLVKPLSAPAGEPQPAMYQNDDPAGTPELYKQYVVAGAMGSGAPQYTGARSEPATVQPCVAATPPPRSTVVHPVAARSRSAGTFYDFRGLFADPAFSATVSQRRFFSDGRVGEAVDRCYLGDLCALIRYPNGDRLAVYSEGYERGEAHMLYFTRTNGVRTFYAFSRNVGHERTTHITLDGGRMHLTIVENRDGSLKFTL